MTWLSFALSGAAICISILSIRQDRRIRARLDRLYPPQYRGVRVVSEREIEECPGCRSRTRRWRDMLWDQELATWAYCLDPWHDAAPQLPMSEESGERP